MRKSISVAFFSTVATLLILGVAVMGLSQLVLFSRYFAQERFDTLDDVGELAGRTVGYFWDDITRREEMDSALDQLDLIGESANVYLFFTDAQGQVVLASSSDHLAREQIPGEVLDNVERAAQEAGGVYHELGRMKDSFDEEFYVSARPIARDNVTEGYIFVCASGQMLDDFVHKVRECNANPLISRTIQESCDYIRANVLKPLTVEEIAKEMGYTTYYFTKKFYKEMGVKVTDYIKEARVHYAKIALLTTRKSIEEISESLHFGSRNYFSKVFRSIVGVTPAAYRENVGKELKES